MILPLGRFTTTAGTLKRLTSTQPDPTAKFAVHGLMIQALPGNTGRVYIGGSGLNVATGASRMATLAIPTANSIPTFTAALTIAPNAINLADFYLDVEVSGEGADVTVLVM